MSLKTSIVSLLATIGRFALNIYQMLLLIPYVDRCSCLLKFLVGTVCNLCSPRWHKEVNLRLCALEDLLSFGRFHLEQQVAVG